MNKEILDAVKERGLLLEKEVFELVEKLSNVGDAKIFLESIAKFSGQKIITKTVLCNSVDCVRGFLSNLEDENKEEIEKIFVNVGISLDVSKIKEKVQAVSSEIPEEKKKDSGFKVFYSETKTDKKLEVKDFVGHFRSRYQQMQRILMDRPQLSNLVAINKISSERQSLSIIGIVTEKRITKNKNLIVKFEDLTGEISALVKFDNEEIFEKARDLQLDDVVGIKGSGNRDLLFIYDVFYPDAILNDKESFEEDISVAFISDIHCGSDRHLGKSFDNFLEWLESGNEDAKKIKYLFVVGDNVDGVGIYPGQENLLKLGTMGEQYELLASYIRRIPEEITIFMCPGQHDATRVAEPQPIISRKYAEALYDIDNLILVTNPTLVKLCEGEKEIKILMYHGASIHSLINEIVELREMKAHKCPAQAIKHMLKRRHLAPSHSEAIYIPNIEKDAMVISEVPDVLCTGEVHKLDVDTYNNVLIITGSCWQAQTPFEEKVGNESDPGKVPVLNLKSRQLKIFDFGDREEIEREY